MYIPHYVIVASVASTYLILVLPWGRGWNKMGAYGSKRFRADLQALKDNDPTLQVSDKSVEPWAAVTMCLGGLAS